MAEAWFFGNKFFRDSRDYSFDKVLIEKKIKEFIKRQEVQPLTVGHVRGVKNDTVDMTFVVQNSKFQGHTTLFVKLSPVIKQMICGPYGWNGTVNITDVQPESFQFFLDIVYEGTRYAAGYMTPRNTLECLLVSNKYLIHDIEEFLRAKLLREITHENVMEILPYCELTLGLFRVQSKCWSMIEGNTLKVLNSPHFVRAGWETFCAILENGRLTIGEYQLFCAAKRWAEYQKKTVQKDKSLLEILGVAIYNIRFPLMSKSEWDQVCRAGVLNKAEILDMNTNFKRNKTFPNRPRKNQCLCQKTGRRCPLCTRKEDDVALSQRLAGHLKHVKKLNRGIDSFNHSSLTRTSSWPAVLPQSEQPSGSKSLVSEIKMIGLYDKDGQPTCECIKYKSCPALPNGKTADQLIKLGYKNF